MRSGPCRFNATARANLLVTKRSIKFSRSQSRPPIPRTRPSQLQPRWFETTLHCLRHVGLHVERKDTDTAKMSKATAARDQIVKLVVGAGQAAPSPPVGPALGSKGIKSMDFCKVCFPIPFHSILAVSRGRTLIFKIVHDRSSTPEPHTSHRAHRCHVESSFDLTGPSTLKCGHLRHRGFS